jgi:hypothetical protein
MSRVVEVKGKSYIVGQVVPAQEEDNFYCAAPAQVSYWGTKDGKQYGPVRTATETAKPGSVAKAVWDAANPS